MKIEIDGKKLLLEKISKEAVRKAVRIPDVWIHYALHKTEYMGESMIIMESIVENNFTPMRLKHLSDAVSEAYGVLNLWAEIRESIIGDVSRRFKFHDFFMSIGLDRSAPYIITEKTSVEDLLRQKDGYAKAPGLDLKPLIESCPFRLKDITYNE